jgi:hypothetical protein
MDKKYFKTLDDVKNACDKKQKVFWAHDGYKVYKDNIGQYLVTCIYNDYTTGLSATDVKKCFILN